jgi:hypothetical protein
VPALNDDTLLLRIPARTLGNMDEAISTLREMRPDWTPLTRSSFARYAIAYVLDQLMVEGVISYPVDLDG